MSPIYTPSGRVFVGPLIFIFNGVKGRIDVFCKTFEGKQIYS
jgi:hypothetical protein